MLGVKSLKKHPAGTCGWNGQRMVDEEVSWAFLVVYTKWFKLYRALVFHVCKHEVMGLKNNINR